MPSGFDIDFKEIQVDNNLKAITQNIESIDKADTHQISKVLTCKKKLIKNNLQKYDKENISKDLLNKDISDILVN